MSAEKVFQELTIDPEFERMGIPVDEKILRRLEDNIKHDGATKPVTVWKGVIIDGHKRYRICQKYGIPFKIKEEHIDDRNAVVEWICVKNLLRCDLNGEYRKYFLGKRFMARFAAANGYESDKDLEYSKKFPVSKCQIAEEIGEEYGLSRIIILKYARYTIAIDSLFSREAIIAEMILSGEIKICSENVIEIAKMSSAELRMIKNYIIEKKGQRFSLPSIRHELRLNRVCPIAPEKLKSPQTQPEIKNMPKYDPDAELANLIYTIPSWNSSIERVINIANFVGASGKARKKLLGQLTILSDTIDQISSCIEEAENEHRNRTGS